MRRTVSRGVTLFVLVALAGCAGMPAGGGVAGATPQVKLERVEIAAYFPYAPAPARVPLVLAFVFNVTNASNQTVTLEEFRFAYSFEAKAGEYFTLNSSWVYDTMHIPPGTTNTLRVVSVLDTGAVPVLLAVSQGFRMQQLGLKIPDLVKAWWDDIGDFKYGIRVTEGVATFATSSGPVLVPFQDSFPQR